MGNLNYKLLLIYLLTAFPLSAQVCDYEQEAKEILNEHGHGRLETASRRYWQLRCQCEKGQIVDESGADYAVRNANEMYDIFYAHMEQYGTSPHIPSHLHPSRKIRMEDCWRKDGTSLDINVNTPDISGCNNAAPLQFNKQGQVYSYAKQFYQAKCICEKGVTSKEREQQILATMEINLKHYNDFKTSSDPVLMSFSAFKSLKGQGCKVLTNEGGTAGVNINTNKGLLINDEYRGLLNELAAESNDPYFKKMVEGMNENSEWISKFKDTGLQYGYLDQSDIEFYNMTENIAQAVKVGEFIYNKIQQKKAEKEAERQRLAAIKKQSDQYIQKVNKFLNGLYEEAAYIPVARDNSKNELISIKASPERFKLYNYYTANHRLLVIKYLESPYLLSVADLQKMQEEIIEQQKRDGTDAILQEIENTSEKDKWYEEYYPFLLNNDRAFKDSYNKMYLELASIYHQTGDSDSSRYYLNKVNSDLSPEAAVKITVRAYKAKNYWLLLRVRPVIRSYFINKKPMAVYNDIKYDHFGQAIQFDQATYLHLLAILSMININDMDGAARELSYLGQFVAEFKSRIGVSAKAGSYTYEDQLFINELGPGIIKTSELYLALAENVLKSREGKHEEAVAALKRIRDEYGFMALANTELTVTDISYEYVKSLIRAELYEAALNACYEMMRADLGQTINRNNLLKEVKFMQAFLEFKMNNTKKSLATVAYLEALGNVSPKTYKLKADIYALLGDDQQVVLAQELYNKAILETNNQ